MLVQSCLKFRKDNVQIVSSRSNGAGVQFADAVFELAGRHAADIVHPNEIPVQYLKGATAGTTEWYRRENGRPHHAGFNPPVALPLLYRRA
jgi:hypothetical protein